VKARSLTFKLSREMHQKNTSAYYQSCCCWLLLLARGKSYGSGSLGWEHLALPVNRQGFLACW